MTVNQQDLARFFDLSVDMMCVAGTDGYFKHLNPAFEQTLGYNQAELLAKPFLEFIHPDDVAATAAEIEKLATGVPTLYFENRYLCKDGSYKWLEWTAYPVGDVLYAIARDVTKQNRLLQDLQDSEALLLALLETAAVAIIVSDPAGQIVMVNVKTEELFGYSRDELVGTSVDTLLPEQLRSNHRGHRDGFFAKPRSREMGLDLNLVARQKDGTAFPIEVGLSFARTAQGDRAVSFIADISERKQAEVEREHLIQELESFSHTVAHDLKNPLGLLIGYSSLLNTDYDSFSDDEKVDMLLTIEKMGMKLVSIIDEILLLAGVRGMGEVELSPLDMADILSGAQGRLLHMIADSHVEITRPASWPVALGYAAWVEEIWANYLSNAIKYGGTPAHVELGATAQSDGMIRFWVRDNGRGLTPEEQARLFVPFTQLKQVRVEGHGLGLSIVQRIAQRLNGQVGVESEVGQGSTFYFTLPGTHQVL